MSAVHVQLLPTQYASEANVTQVELPACLLCSLAQAGLDAEALSSAQQPH